MTASSFPLNVLSFESVNNKIKEVIAMSSKHYLYWKKCEWNIFSGDYFEILLQSESLGTWNCIHMTEEKY